MKSPIRKNDIVCQILYTNPYDLVCSEEYQASVLSIVRKFRQKGAFRQESESDVVQEVTTRILEKISLLQKNYVPTYGNFKPYFIKVVYNFTVKLLASNQKKQSFINDFAMTLPQRLASETKPELLSDELNKLHLYLSKKHRRQAKLVLLMKVYSRSILDEQDIKDFLPQVPTDTLKRAMHIFGQNYAQLKDQELYQYINTLVNEVEGKKNSVDAVRKWLSIRLAELIQWMNRQSRFQYDREAVRNLMRLFFLNEELVVKE